MKYKRRPCEVDAFQLTEVNRWDPTTWPDWLVAAWKKPNEEVGSVYPTPGEGDPTMTVRTACQRDVRVEFGNWITRNASGELYFYLSDCFDADYEPIDPDPTVGMPPPDPKDGFAA